MLHEGFSNSSVTELNDGCVDAWRTKTDVSMETCVYELLALVVQNDFCAMPLDELDAKFACFSLDKLVELCTGVG